jgi:hypothetical protein
MSKLIDTDGLNKLTQGLNDHVKTLIDKEEARAKIAEENIKTNLNEHTHKYASSDSVGGPAKSANKVNKSLILQMNGGSSEGSTQFTFNGSAERIVNISPKTIRQNSLNPQKRWRPHHYYQLRRLKYCSINCKPHPATSWQLECNLARATCSCG